MGDRPRQGRGEGEDEVTAGARPPNSGETLGDTTDIAAASRAPIARWARGCGWMPRSGDGAGSDIVSMSPGGTTPAQ